MFKVTVLGFEHAYASAITGAMDLFALAGVTWQRLQGDKPDKQFHVELASVDGRPIQCINQIQLNSQVAIGNITHTDLLLIPTIGGVVESVIAENAGLIPHIRRLHATGSDIASNCSGAFFLAEAGLLTNKPATTHWGYADLFRQKYPMVDLQEEQLITHAEGVFCSGGGMAWFDLALLLIERYCGHEVASQTAKAHVIDLARDNQAAYAHVTSKKHHQDRDIHNIQEWLETHYSEPVQISALASRFNMSQRTMIRRFKHATGVTPLHYLQNVRLETAKKHLEKEHWPLQQVIAEVGYDDVSSFSRLFQRNNGLTPNQYRNKFKRRVINRLKNR